MPKTTTIMAIDIQSITNKFNTTKALKPFAITTTQSARIRGAVVTSPSLLPTEELKEQYKSLSRHFGGHWFWVEVKEVEGELQFFFLVNYNKTAQWDVIKM